MVILVPEEGIKAVAVYADIIVAHVSEETVCGVALNVFILSLLLCKRAPSVCIMACGTGDIPNIGFKACVLIKDRGKINLCPVAAHDIIDQFVFRMHGCAGDFVLRDIAPGVAAVAQFIDHILLTGNTSVCPGPQLKLIGTVMHQVTCPALA